MLNVANPVKHFKFEPRGKRRLHKRPNASESRICRRWINRGTILDVANGLRSFLTIRPSALLRLQDKEEKRSAYATFMNALRSINNPPSLPQAKPRVRKAG
jgi:uracil-DNA glycosylase